MGFIRVIHQKHYDPDKGNFKSLAFKPSSDGSGISVIDEKCISQSGIGVCEHINRFYKDLAGKPPIFWRIPTEELPENHRFIQRTSTTGDACHYNLTGISEKESRTLLKRVNLSEFNVCSENGGDRPLTDSDMLVWSQT